jgi:aryl-alcohol dehydrogenase-like predicted oxidoreductase
LTFPTNTIGQRRERELHGHEPDYYGEADEAESIATVHRAIDLGVNFFDTAEAYGLFGATAFGPGSTAGSVFHRATLRGPRWPMEMTSGL